MRVELLWWEGCPSTEKALEDLREALAAEGLDPDAIDVRAISSDEEAERERFPGSPTIRIDGRDVQPEVAAESPPALTCRLYFLEDGRPSPLPSREMIRRAVRAAAAGGA